MASDRRGLWRLCAYGAGGVVAALRLSELPPDGRFAFDMKRALPDGRRCLVMSGVELLDKLVPLIPPTYAYLTRFITATCGRCSARHPHQSGVQFASPCGWAGRSAGPSPKSGSLLPVRRQAHRRRWRRTSATSTARNCDTSSASKPPSRSSTATAWHSCGSASWGPTRSRLHARWT